MQRFANKTAIVSGASKGLGYAIAERLTAEGAGVIITGRGQAALDDAVRQLSKDGADVAAVQGDVADADAADRAVDAALERWGRIDVLVNNAGAYDEAPFLDIPRERWDYMLAVMLTGPFMLAQRAGRAMVEAGHGSIVNIASIDGHLADGPYASYDVAKAGLLMLTKNIAVELGPHGVRCNSISPGWAETPMVESACPPDMYARMRTDFRRVPIGRLLKPAEVAAACAFLASDEASGITGTDLLVDGGTLADAWILPTLEEASTAPQPAEASS